MAKNHRFPAPSWNADPVCILPNACALAADRQSVIYAGCYTKPYNKFCFSDLVWHYGPLNSTYCFHTCTDYFCDPYLAWLDRIANDTDLRPNVPSRNLTYLGITAKPPV